VFILGTEVRPLDGRGVGARVGVGVGDGVGVAIGVGVGLGVRLGDGVAALPHPATATARTRPVKPRQVLRAKDQLGAKLPLLRERIVIWL
jgi:hypothetical protein